MGNKDRVKQRTRKGKKRRFSSNQYSRKTVIKTPTADPASLVLVVHTQQQHN